MIRILRCLLFVFPVLPLKSQELAPTMTDALLKVRVTDLSGLPSEGEIITFVDKSNHEAYEGITNSEGTFEILIPKGATYIVKYRNFGYDHQYAEHEIPEYDGMLVSKINIKYQLPSKSVLENVYFQSDHVTLDPKSFPSLDKLAALLKVKQSTNIQLAAHSDNRWSLEKSKKITASQAENIKSYLVEKGIPGDRIQTLGHGSKLPMASNETAAGMAKNNRVEVAFVK